MNKYDRRATGKIIHSDTLIEIYKYFKRSPKRVFIKKDFYKEYEILSRHLNILLRMGLIERVDVRYKAGKKHLTSGVTNGYRIKA